MNNMNSESIGALNSLLASEISAVESYNQAITKLESSTPVTTFEEMQIAHAKRAQRLRQRIEQLGGTPTESSGMWGAFAKLVSGGASVFGAKPAVSALEEGEDKGLNDYKNALDKLDEESRQLIMTEFLPCQERTHSTMSMLKKELGS